MARAALCVVLCAVYCILASVLLRVPPLKFPSLPISIPPTLLPCSYPSLRCTIPPPRDSPPLVPSMPPHSFLPQPSLPSSTSAPTPSHHRFLAPPCALPPPPSVCSLPPILHPSSLLPSSLSTCLLPAVQFNKHRMRVWQVALYGVAPSHACH